MNKAYEHTAATVDYNGLSYLEDLCGDIAYQATFRGNTVNEFTTPMAYIMGERTFYIYTEDPDDVGEWPLFIEAYFVNYPDNIKSTDLTPFIIIDVCGDLETFVPGNQPVPEIYRYTGVDAPMTFSVNEFIIEPQSSADSCPVTYSCSGDLCEFFDLTALSFSIDTVDIVQYPSGTY